MDRESTTEQTPIEIQMFGGFRITVEDKTISDTDTRTRQLWHLLQYLITFRDKTVSQEEIIKVMWPENNIENPANALKNLVYRIRTTFADWGIPYAREMIVYNRNSYQWNNSLPCIVDTEQFETYCKNAMEGSAQGEEYQLEQYGKAISLYRGDFLPSSSSESWVIPISSYMRTLFFKSVYATLDILKRRDNEESYEQMILICRKTLIIDPLEEAIHRDLIYALYKQGKQHQALEHYRFVTEQFYEELGMGPTDAMQQLYHEISRSGFAGESNIEALTADLKEEGEPQGAFYCEYEVFKNLYRLEARTAARNGRHMFICMLTATAENPEKEFTIDVQTRVMSTLKSAIFSSLRKGDVFSRFSATQFVLLLPTGSYDNCEMVIARILRNYRKVYHNSKIGIHAKIVPLEPTG